jgi:hypothetical protein
MSIYIKIDGLDKLTANLKAFEDDLVKTMTAAGREAATTIILDTPGLQPYPKNGPGNLPPVPYYIRGRGMQVSDTKNRMDSERMGSQNMTGEAALSGTKYFIKVRPLQVTIGNRASYANRVIGEKQSPVMARIGWLKMSTVAQRRTPEIVKIFQLWINKLLKEKGLI